MRAPPPALRRNARLHLRNPNYLCGAPARLVPCRFPLGAKFLAPSSSVSDHIRRECSSWAEVRLQEVAARRGLQQVQVAAHDSHSSGHEARRIFFRSRYFSNVAHAHGAAGAGVVAPPGPLDGVSPPHQEWQQPEQQPKHFTASEEEVSAPTASPTCALVAVPESRQAVAAWLFATAGCLFGMIVIGGYTRLSGSGLSMTKWKFQGTLLPPTKEAWEAEFAAYRKTPEYQKLHAGTMDLPHFQRIYFVEWFHRMWGRMTGLVFGVPLLVFLSRAEVFKFAKTKSSFSTTFLSKKCPLTPRLGLQLTGLLALGISQAVVGWWMVRSGFVDPKEHMPHSDNPVPRVSAYRLATHLAAALTIYGGVLWTAIKVKDGSTKPWFSRFSFAGATSSSKPSTHSLPLSRAAADSPHTAARAARELVQKHAKGGSSTGFRRLALAQAVLVAITIVSGAFVAGNDAGLDYNTWPKMLDHWVPPKVTAGYAGFAANPRVLLEDTACVQFNHRLLAYCAALGSLAVAARAHGLWNKAGRMTTAAAVRSTKRGARSWFTSTKVAAASTASTASTAQATTAVSHAPLIPKDAFFWAGYALPAAVFGQICLGITTLLHCVPVELGVAHQAGGVGVLSVLITLLAKL